MAEHAVRLDAGLVAAAAGKLGMDAESLGTAEAARAILRHVAGTAVHRAAAAGGAAPKRAGRAWENEIVSAANAAGFPWDKAPLRGARDLLDITGCLPDGWLIGGKSVARGVSAAEKLSGAMDQCERALANLELRGPAPDVIPLQVIQRPGSTVDRAYAVTEYGWFLKLAWMRRQWRQAISV